MDSGKNEDSDRQKVELHSELNQLISLTTTLSALSIFLPQGLAEPTEPLWTALTQLSSLRQLTLAEETPQSESVSQNVSPSPSPQHFHLLVSSIEENVALQTAASAVLGRLTSLNVARLRWPANMLHCLNGGSLCSLAFNTLLIRADESYYARRVAAYAHSSSEDDRSLEPQHYYGPMELPADAEYAGDVLLFITTKLTLTERLKMPPDWWSLLA